MGPHRYRTSRYIEHNKIVIFRLGIRPIPMSMNKHIYIYVYGIQKITSLFMTKTIPKLFFLYDIKYTFIGLINIRARSG